jgi:hypothetical protein
VEGLVDEQLHELGEAAFGGEVESRGLGIVTGIHQHARRDQHPRSVERTVVCRSHQHGVAKSITVFRAGAALDRGLQRLEIVAYHGVVQRIRDRGGNQYGCEQRGNHGPCLTRAVCKFACMLEETAHGTRVTHRRDARLEARRVQKHG